MEKDINVFKKKLQIALHGGAVDGMEYDHLIGPTWDVERVIWIGYYKNDQNQQCLLPRLYKEGIKQILSFV